MHRGGEASVGDRDVVSPVVGTPEVVVLAASEASEASEASDGEVVSRFVVCVLSLAPPEELQAARSRGEQRQTSHL